MGNVLEGVYFNVPVAGLNERLFEFFSVTRAYRYIGSAFEEDCFEGRATFLCDVDRGALTHISLIVIIEKSREDIVFLGV